MRSIGKTRKQLEAGYSPLRMVWAFVGSLPAAYGLARILSWIPGATLSTGIMVRFLAGACFTLAPVSIHDVMEGCPCKLTAINVLYHIIGFVLIGIVFGAWR